MPTVDGKLLRFALVSITAVSAMSVSVAHAMTEQQYLKALKVAQEKVDRTRVATNSAAALSSPIIKAYFGRYYKVGDSWDVAAWELKNPIMKPFAVSENESAKTGRGGIFRYTVKEVRNGETPQVVIQVTQIRDLGFTPVDSKVEELTLTMTDRTVQTEKLYHLIGRADPVKVSPDGLRSRITSLELFPLDVPEIATAVRNTPSSLPTLPPAVQAVASRTEYAPVREQSSWLEQDDFFGRPVQILWQHGDPWPSYLKTSNGVAILIRRRTS